MTPPLSHAIELIQAGIHQHLHPGGQLYVSQNFRPIADLAFGEAQPGVPTTPQTIFQWLSATKPIAAIALARLVERGVLDWDDPVAKIIPPFAQHGKQTITFRHLLTHTSGLLPIHDLDLTAPWPDLISAICQSPLPPDSIPGRRAAYQPVSSWLILAEAGQRLSGKYFTPFIREEIFLPLSMTHCWIGMPEPQYQACGPQIGFLYSTDTLPPRLDPLWNRAEGAAIASPGNNGRGPIRELAKIYEMLLNHGTDPSSGFQLLKPSTVRDLISPQRVGLFDETFRSKIDMGLGFILDSKRYGDFVPYGYGPFCSEKTFGHSGAQSSCVFADPDHQLVVAWILNGKPGEPKHQRRARDLNAAIYKDLCLLTPNAGTFQSLGPDSSKK